MSLRDELSLLVNPAPKFHDPEDDEGDETRAQLIDKPTDDFEDDDVRGPSRLRAQASVELGEEDVKYAGRRVSRQLLDVQDSDGAESGNTDESEASDEDEDVDEDEDEGDEDGDEDSSDEDEVQLDRFNSELNSVRSSVLDEDEASDSDSNNREDNSEDISGNSSGDNVDDSDHGDSEEDMNSDNLSEGDAEDSNIQSFSRRTLEEEIEKGNAAKAQLGLWDSLLESRIKMQKALLAVNQLPPPTTTSLFRAEGGEQYEKTLEQGCDLLSQLGVCLLELQDKLLRQNPETDTLSQGDDEGSGSNEGSAEGDFLGRKRKSSEDFEVTVCKRHKAFQQYRNDTIQKWNDKTQLSSGKLNSKSFSAFNQSALKQIEQLMSDKDRLVKRTQLVRSGQRMLSQPAEESQTGDKKDAENEQTRKSDRGHLTNYNEEVFNDDDFYHQLLRELIEKKTSDLNDPVALSRHWLEVQKMRSKVKGKVDTRASKGRKIRYDVHPKLVNFMAPYNSSAWNDDSRNDLYSSLYGQRHQVPSQQIPG